MTKKITILISILLIISAVLIELLLRDSNTKLDIELVKFFSGIVFGSGASILLMTIFRKKND